LAYRVYLLEPARGFLAELAADQRTRARDLALVLLSLGKNPRPEGSRPLAPSLLEQVEGECVWERPDWIITYEIDLDDRSVLVGLIEERR
jgi:hypothetical protein